MQHVTRYQRAINIARIQARVCCLKCMIAAPCVLWISFSEYIPISDAHVMNGHQDQMGLVSGLGWLQNNAMVN